MKIFINILLIIFAVIIQTAFLPALSVLGSHPNIVLIIAIILLAIQRKSEALWWFGFGGLILDLISPFYFGIYTLSFMVVYFILYYLVDYIFSDPSILVTAMFLLFGSFISNIIFLILDINTYEILIIEALYAMVFGSIIFYFMKHYLSHKDAVKI